MSVDGHPQMMAQTAALSMARMINAVAWKMPLPAPAWFGELQAHDSVPPLLASFHFQSASYRESGARMFPTKLFAGSVDHDRQLAERRREDRPRPQLRTGLASAETRFDQSSKRCRFVECSDHPLR
jgi:hypothetical protein